MAAKKPRLKPEEVIHDLQPHVETGMPPLPQLIEQIKGIMNQHPDTKPAISFWLMGHPEEQLKRVP